MYSRICEDIYDIIIADDRVNEPKESYETVKQKMKKRFSKWKNMKYLLPVLLYCL